MKHCPATTTVFFRLRLWTILLAAIASCLILASCGETPQETCNRLDKTANEYFASNHYQKAIDTWSELLAIKPGSPAVQQKVGNCYAKMAMYKLALRSYNNAVRLQPENWQLWYKIAQLQLTLMNLPAAAETWEKVKPHINNCSSLVFQGDLLLLQNKYDKAEQKYRQARSKEPQNQAAMIRLAICLAAQGKNPEADETFKTLSNLSPQSADILLQMGNFCSIRDDDRNAQHFIHQAMKIEPENYSLKIEAANLYLETGKYEQAVTILQEFSQNTPNNRYAKKLLIESLLLANRYPEARQQFDKLTSTEKKDWEFQLLESKYFLNTMQLQAAIAQLQTILDNEPDIPLVHYFTGLAYLAAGLNNLGQQNLTKCLTLSPGFTQAELLLADTYFKNKDYDLALQYVNRIKKREPENYRSYLIAGNIHLTRKEYHAALADYQDAFYLYPGNTMSLYYIALSTYLEGNTANALSSLQALLQNDPAPTDAALQYARILCRDDKSPQAIKFMRQAIKKKPKNPYLHYILGEIYLAAENNENAVQEFNGTLAIKPGMKASYLKLFALYGNEEIRLKELLNSAIANNKNFSEATIRLARLYCEKGLPSKAITTLEKAMLADPHNPLLANNLAWLYAEYQPDKIDKAINLAQTAYEKLQGNPAAADTLGWIYFKKGMYTRAAWLLNQAITSAPDNSIVAGHLARVQKALSN